MDDIENKLREKMIDAKIVDIKINIAEHHGVTGFYITLDDGTVIELDALERNGGGYIKVTADDIL